jgi:hypothetical protein
MDLTGIDDEVGTYEIAWREDNAPFPGTKHQCQSSRNGAEQAMNHVTS